MPSLPLLNTLSPYTFAICIEMEVSLLLPVGGFFSEWALRLALPKYLTSLKTWHRWHMPRGLVLLLAIKIPDFEAFLSKSFQPISHGFYISYLYILPRFLLHASTLDSHITHSFKCSPSLELGCLYFSSTLLVLGTPVKEYLNEVKLFS